MQKSDLLKMKKEVVECCLRRMEDNISHLSSLMAENSESTKSESKSSAGDKHETGRAMMHLEQEKVAMQLQEALNQKEKFEKLILRESNSVIGKGSLVETNKGLFFISVGLGKLEVTDFAVYAISSEAPLALHLNGKKQGDKMQFNGQQYDIKAVI